MTHTGRSRELRVDGGFLRPLVNPDTGIPFDHVPCQDNPPMWDEDAPALDQQAAAVLCGICLAIKPCRARRRKLGRNATGVWAGKIVTSRGEEEPPETGEVYDPEVAGWAAAAGVSGVSGVTITTTRRKAAQR